jgi:hypothetical protein
MPTVTEPAIEPTIDDIIAEKEAALAILDQRIQDARAKRDAATGDKKQQFDEPIRDLIERRTTIYGQAVAAMMDSAEMAAALRTLQGATNDMNHVAARMGSVTGFFNNVADLLDAGGKVAAAIKRPAPASGAS